MLKVFDINNNRLKENIDYIINGSVLIDITMKIDRVEHLHEIKPNRKQRRLINNNITT